jgi:UDP-galactopyranose mutase
MVDFIIVGTGYAGSVLANLLATKRNTENYNLSSETKNISVNS